jgi:hypothetical protein
MPHKINLFINLYHIESDKRKNEVLQSLKKNCNNKYVSTIMILKEETTEPKDWIIHEKIYYKSILKRPSFADYAPYLKKNGINIIANNDVWFDNSLSWIKRVGLGGREMFAFTRREKDGKLFHGKQGDAFDAWGFNGKPDFLIHSDYFLGIPGCDNRIVADFALNNYRCFNVGKFINLYHEHNSNERNYKSKDRLSGPYVKLKPLGLIEFLIWRILYLGIVKKKYFSLTYRYEES